MVDDDPIGGRGQRGCGVQLRRKSRERFIESGDNTRGEIVSVEVVEREGEEVAEVCPRGVVAE